MGGVALCILPRISISPDLSLLYEVRRLQPHALAAMMFCLTQDKRAEDYEPKPQKPGAEINLLWSSVASIKEMKNMNHSSSIPTLWEGKLKQTGCHELSLVTQGQD